MAVAEGSHQIPNGSKSSKTGPHPRIRQPDAALGLALAGVTSTGRVPEVAVSLLVLGGGSLVRGEFKVSVDVAAQREPRRGVGVAGKVCREEVGDERAHVGA
jgi:hypothetical protein